MPFISENLLLDLPFNQPLDNNSTQWLDASGQGWNATAKNCEPSTLDLLGSCLKIKPGGHLVFQNLTQQTPAWLTSNLTQLTIEFWAEPDSAAIGEAQKYILKGPVTIWMEEKNLYWSLGQNSYLIQKAEGLHHWAVVVNQTVDAAQVTFIKDGVEVTNLAQIIPITDELKAELAKASPEINNNFIIGSMDDQNGWTGKLAHLRIWGTALSATQIEQNRQRDVTAHTAFKDTTGIEWRLVNADDEPALYIHSNGLQELRLELKNVTQNTTLVIPANNKAASFSEHHFCLVFRPGTISSLLLQKEKEEAANKFIQTIQKKNPGWNVSLDKWCLQDCICFLWAGPANKELIPKVDENKKTDEDKSKDKERLTLFIPEITAEPGSGSRPTEVGLSYKNVEIQNSERVLDGHRAQRLNILYRETSLRQPPLEVGVVGAPVVLNNGEETCLTLYIKNLNRNEDGAAAPLVLGDASAAVDKQPKFILEIDTLTEAVEISDLNLNKGDKYYLYSLSDKQTKIFKIMDKQGRSLIVNQIKPVVQNSQNITTTIMDLAQQKALVSSKGSLNAKVLGDCDDLMNIEPRFTHDRLEISSPHASGNVVSLIISPKESTDLVNFQANETVTLSLTGLKTTAPPGRSVLRLRYKDFDRYGEGVFEIPVDRVSAIPAKLTKEGGVGYGLAIGYDPRVGKNDPNADAMNEMLSIKQIGNGDAVLIENAGTGAGLTVVQTGNGRSANFSGGRGVEIANKPTIPTNDSKSNGSSARSMDALLSVQQMGNESAARIVRTENANSNSSPASQPQGNSLDVPPLVHLKLDQISSGQISDSSGNNRNGTINGSLLIQDDARFGKCLKFDGASQNYVTLPPETIPTGKKATFSFWAWGDDSLPADTCLIHANADQRVLILHLPWANNNIYFDCGCDNTGYDRISQIANSEDFKGRWTHWAFTKDAESGEMIIYLDGSLWCSDSGSSKTRLLPQARTVTLGRNDPSEQTLHSYRGKLAHFRSYDHVLSVEQIRWQIEQDLGQKDQKKPQKDQDQMIPTVHIENRSCGSGLTVIQHSDELAAEFSGGKGVEITGNLQVGQRIRDKTGEIMPVGAVLPFAGKVAPEGWLLCNGQRVIGDKYKDLAKVLFDEEKFVFNIPDYREKFITGAADTGGYTLGANGGQAYVTLTESQMPKHKHDVRDNGHIHLVPSMRFGDNNRYARGNADMVEFSHLAKITYTIQEK